MINLLVRWLVFVHVLAVITFFLAHGTSAAMAFQLRKETEFSRIRALLDLSWSTQISHGCILPDHGIDRIGHAFPDPYLE